MRDYMIPYLQTTSFTTAASSLLAILHHSKPEINLTRENEFDIWKKTATLPTRGSSIYALAIYAQQCGFKPQVIVEKKEYDFPDYRFYRYTKEDIDNAGFSSDMYLAEAQEKNIDIQEKDVSFRDIHNELKKNILLLRLNAKPLRNEKRNTSNYLVVYEYSERQGHFQLIDPLQGNISVAEPVLKEAFESLETKKYRNHKMILFPKNNL